MCMPRQGHTNTGDMCTLRDTVSAGLRFSHSVRRGSYTRDKRLPTGAHGHIAHTHTHPPKPTLVHMQAQKQRRHTQKHLEHRTQGSQRRASTRSSPTLPESRSHPGSPPHQPSAAQPYLGNLRGSWDPRDPDSLGQQQSRARSACLTQPWVRMGLRLPHSGSCSCSFSDARPDAAAWCGAGGGEEAAAPPREGPCRLEEGAPGWRRTDARTRVHPRRRIPELGLDTWTQEYNCTQELRHMRVHTHTHTHTHKDTQGLGDRHTRTHRNI